ncbi:HPr kinase/phosphorylase [Aquicoccus sp. G2-2]|uniref:HPr kinase/phosphorylase n=1 Tax=Aquicoccus sp. G2-2 TaxID=3092120 RepID=UPI002AE06E92|nr:serine kinase [Aquicoccus sp. G2-2]MEA1113797.1 serine kinase [Aquicoccus sp. G2-2]
MAGPEPPETILHASCVAFEGKGALILGPSGAGKSALALELMARGASLVADDRVVLQCGDDGEVMASAPAAIAGRIEARCVGILNAVPAGPVRLVLVVDLGQREAARLPPKRTKNLLGQTFPLLHNVASDHFAAAILQYLRAGRNA